MRFSIVLALIAGLLLFGCKPSSHTDSKQGGDTAALGDTVTTSSGLKYIDLKVGSGAAPQVGQTVSVHYTGWLTNGRKFDSSRDRGQPYEFPLGQHKVVRGWDEGISTMKVGGQRKLIIPAELGYGNRGRGDAIPPGATLIFDVELMGVR